MRFFDTKFPFYPTKSIYILPLKRKRFSYVSFLLIFFLIEQINFTIADRRKITIRGNIAIVATRKKRERRSLVSFSKSFLEGSKRNSGYKLVSRRGRGRERERKVLDDTRTYLSEVWGNRWFDNRKLETRGGMLAISRSRNSKIGGKWNATGRG